MANINLELLKIFYEVAKEESITRASENLFISQPAVSQSIKKLEEELGGVLFNRSNKGISLTNEGREFFEYVKDAFEILDKGQDEFSNFKQLNKGTIRIGISTTLTKLVLIDGLVRFHKDYPQIKIEIVNGLTSSILDELQQGKLDLAIYGDDVKNEKLETICLKTCHHVFVYNKDFFSINNPISIKELLSKPLILQNRQSNTRKMFDNIVKKFNFKKLDYTEVVSQELVKILTECGFGFGFVIRESLKDDNLSIAKLEEDLPSFEVKLARSALIKPTFASKKFIEYIVKNN